jgi:2-(1,2-epoxy-1,2-dihydrophenyl)acetyl-CoA isomerase
MAAEEPLVVERHGSSVRLVLPRSGNLVLRELSDALKGAQRDADVRSVVLTGGSESFGAGETDEAALAGLAAAIAQLRTLPLPTLAVITGDARGLGASLVLACDLRLASLDASLTLSSVAGGAPLDLGVTWELLRTLGRARTLDLLYSSRTLTAAEADELGLLTHVVAEPELAGLVDAVANDLAKLPRHALGAIKRTVNRAEEVGFDEALEFDFLLGSSPQPS